jgi:phospholipid/cholesterol/gamma-HCH transport system permease protein
VKAASFGTAVALAGSLEGLATRGGAEGVGRAATRAVVFGCMAILVLDAFWALVLL